jgi:hypothetical protein
MTLPIDLPAEWPRDTRASRPLAAALQGALALGNFLNWGMLGWAQRLAFALNSCQSCRCYFIGSLSQQGNYLTIVHQMLCSAG